MSLIQSLFSLRGTLPSRTYLIIELLGTVFLLLIWQILASISTQKTKNIANTELKVYYSNQTAIPTQLNNPLVLIYDLPAQPATELQTLVQQANSSQQDLLIVTATQNPEWAKQLGSNTRGIVVVAQALEPKVTVFKTLSRTTGSSIVNTDFIAGDSTLQITKDFAGSVDQISLNQQGATFVTQQNWISNSLLPSPVEVVTSLGELYTQNNLLSNLLYSLYLNLAGYLLAVLIAIPIGFLIGLFPLFKALFSRNVDALRFVPLTAVTGLFIAWFGLGSSMKVTFLAFGIIVYLLPVVVQRILEVEDVYVQTAYTLGATKWQRIKSVFIPAVLSRVSDDIRVLVAISWTYIIVTEVVNANSGGIGALAFKMARQSQIDKVFAILLVIIIVGFLQDLLFKLIDRLLFDFKYQTKGGD
jgi:NitT/TauT family transport system permease protein